MARPRHICGTCKKEMSPLVSGVYVVLMAWDPPKPYEIWHADSWICKHCGHTFVTGFADRGKQHHEANFDELLKSIMSTRHKYPVYEVHER